MMAPIVGLSFYKSWLYAIGLLPIVNMYFNDQIELENTKSILRAYPKIK